MSVLWSWDEYNAHWMAVNQGAEADMQDRARVMYATARRAGVAGAAWTVTAGAAPTRGPRALGIEIVGASDPPSTDQSTATLLNMAIERSSVPEGARRAARAEVDQLRKIRARARAWMAGESGIHGGSTPDQVVRWILTGGT